MSKGIIEKTQRISSKMTTFIWFFGMCNFFKMDKYFETDGVYIIPFRQNLFILLRFIKWDPRKMKRNRVFP